MGTFKHVLVATDFSDTSAAAVRLARALVAETHAALTLVHVCEIPAGADTGPLRYEVVTPLAQAAQARLDALLAEVRRELPEAGGLVKLGAAWEQILAVAADVGADLVVLGTHGRRGFAHALIGSVAERVVRTSPVPVLTVGPRRREDGA